MHYKPSIWGISRWKTLCLSIFLIASAWSLSWGHHGSAAPSLPALCRRRSSRLVHVSPPDSHLASSMFSHYTSMGIIGIWATKQHPHDMFLDIFLMVSFLTQKGTTSCGRQTTSGEHLFTAYADKFAGSTSSAQQVGHNVPVNRMRFVPAKLWKRLPLVW